MPSKKTPEGEKVINQAPRKLPVRQRKPIPPMPDFRKVPDGAPEDWNRLLTVNDVARWLGLHVITVYRKAKAGEIPSTLVGSARRFRRSDIEAYLTRQTTGLD